MKNLTVAQLRHACEKHRFLLLRQSDGVMAVNSKIAPIALKRKRYNDNDETNIVSYHPCGFQEYISRKAVLTF